MTMIRFKLLLATLAAALALGGVAYAATFTAAKHNAAYVELAPQTPDASRLDLALGLRQNDTDVVDEENSALAISRCDGCRSIAIAFQVVIVQGNPAEVRPQNVAVALNEECDGCSALALAHQFVVGRGEPARITSAGREQLYDVGRDLLRLERDYRRYTDAQISARVAGHAADVKEILDRELVPVRAGGSKPDVEEDREVRRAA